MVASGVPGHAGGAFVVFLRGVNLAARNKVPMKELATKLGEELGSPVGNYLQSGNLIVRTDDKAALAPLVSGLIARHYGHTVPAVVRSADELAGLLAVNPWPEEDPLKVHLAMWDEPHEQAAADAMTEADWGGDLIVFSGSNAWLRFSGQSHNSRLNAQTIDRRLRVTMTARNVRTIRAVAELAEARPGS